MFSFVAIAQRLTLSGSTSNFCKYCNAPMNLTIRLRARGGLNSRLLPSAWAIKRDAPESAAAKSNATAVRPRRRASPAEGAAPPAVAPEIKAGAGGNPRESPRPEEKQETPRRKKTRVKTKRKKKRKDARKDRGPPAVPPGNKAATQSGAFCQSATCGKQQPRHGFLFCKYCGCEIQAEAGDQQQPHRFCTKCGCSLQEEERCPKCEPDASGSTKKESGARLDRRRTILFDADVANSMQLRQRRGTLLYRANEDKSSRQAPKIPWSSLELEREVGEGGYAIVHVGRWQQRRVAVKELKIVESDGGATRDFENEIRVLTALRNPNITEFHGACIEGDRLGYVMEYCSQGSLSFLLVRDDIKMDWMRRLNWLSDVANAVNYLHCLTPKIIHRDLKSDNVLVDAEGNAKICDFGLCKAKSLAAQISRKSGRSSTHTSARQSFVQRRMSVIQFSQEAGTPQYMAPELIRKAPYSERVDSYSFGIFSWEVIAREWAHMDLDPMEIMTKVKLQRLRPHVESWVPKSLGKLLKMCWHERAERRPSFAAIQKMLEELKLESGDWEDAPNSDPSARHQQMEERLYGEEGELEEIIYEEIVEVEDGVEIVYEEVEEEIIEEEIIEEEIVYYEDE